jgi:hypothetical protein
LHPFSEVDPRSLGDGSLDLDQLID